MMPTDDPKDPELSLPGTDIRTTGTGSSPVETRDPAIEAISRLQRYRYMPSRVRQATFSPLHSLGDKKLDELLERAELLEVIIHCLQADPILQQMFVDSLTATSTSEREQIPVSKALIRRVSIVFTAISFLGNLISLILLFDGLVPGLAAWIAWLWHLIFGAH